MPADDARSDYESHRLLRTLAGRLNEHGMRTREYTHGHVVVEIAATNPRDPDKGGRVVIGFEGYLVWEYWTEFKTESEAVAAADVIHVLLTEDLTARHQETENPSAHSEPSVRAAVDSARAGSADLPRTELLASSSFRCRRG
jgi:hypothetical protein